MELVYELRDIRRDGSVVDVEVYSSRISLGGAALAENINVYISTKEAPLNIEKVRLQEILQMIKDEFSTQLSIREIKWFQPESVPDMKVDRLSILRALRNLVDNALKYGGDELSEIRIGYEPSDCACQPHSLPAHATPCHDYVDKVAQESYSLSTSSFIILRSLSNATRS